MSDSKEIKEKVYCIYMHTSPSGKSYIGLTSNYKRRSNTHKNNSNKNCNSFSRAIEKYGWDNFVHEILIDGLTIEEANYWEDFCILEFDTLSPKGYNLRTGGNCASDISEETRERMKRAARIRCDNYTDEKKLEIENKRKLTLSLRTEEDWIKIAEKTKATRANKTEEDHEQYLTKLRATRDSKTEEERKAISDKIVASRRMSAYGTTDADVIAEKIKLRKRENSKRYRLENLEKCIAYDKNRNANLSPEQKARLAERSREFRKNNPEKVKSYESRKIKKELTDEQKEAQTIYSKEYYEKNKEKILARQKQKRELQKLNQLEN